MMMTLRVVGVAHGVSHSCGTGMWDGEQVPVRSRHAQPIVGQRSSRVPGSAQGAGRVTCAPAARARRRRGRPPGSHRRAGGRPPPRAGRRPGPTTRVPGRSPGRSQPRRPRRRAQAADVRPSCVRSLAPGRAGASAERRRRGVGRRWPVTGRRSGAGSESGRRCEVRHLGGRRHPRRRRALRRPVSGGGRVGAAAAAPSAASSLSLPRRRGQAPGRWPPRRRRPRPRRAAATGDAAPPAAPRGRRRARSSAARDAVERRARRRSEARVSSRRATTSGGHGPVVARVGEQAAYGVLLGASGRVGLGHRGHLLAVLVRSCGDAGGRRAGRAGGPRERRCDPTGRRGLDGTVRRRVPVRRVTGAAVRGRASSSAQLGAAARAPRLHGALGAARASRRPRRRGSPPCRPGRARPAGRPAAWQGGQHPAAALASDRRLGRVVGAGPAVARRPACRGPRRRRAAPRPPDLGGPEPVEAGVDDHPVQPGGHRGLAPEGAGPTEGRDHAVLEPVGGVLGVAHRAQRDRPQPVAVPGEELAERLGVAVDVGPQQRLVASVGSSGSLIRGTCTSEIVPRNPPSTGGSRSARPSRSARTPPRRGRSSASRSPDAVPTGRQARDRRWARSR